MSKFGQDPLVGILHLIIAFIMGVLAFAMLMVTIGFIAVPFLQLEHAEELAEASSGFAAWQVVLMIEAVLAGIFVLLGLAEYFFVLLWRILASVREGDPFALINSVRLTRMAWTAVAGHVWAFLLGIYAAWLESVFEHVVTEGDINFDFGGGGLILILVLFVLARVFRKGTEMREDLEGTV